MIESKEQSEGVNKAAEAWRGWFGPQGVETDQADCGFMSSLHRIKEVKTREVMERLCNAVYHRMMSDAPTHEERLELREAYIVARDWLENKEHPKEQNESDRVDVDAEKWTLLSYTDHGRHRLWRVPIRRGWLPMETALKDGTRIMLACAQPEFGFWDPSVGMEHQGSWVMEYVTGPIMLQPTHWQPCPPPPPPQIKE